MTALALAALIFDTGKVMNMHVLILVVAAIVVFACGFACRGFVSRELGVAREDVLAFANRLENAAVCAEVFLRAEAQAVANDIRKLL